MQLRQILIEKTWSSSTVALLDTNGRIEKEFVSNSLDNAVGELGRYLDEQEEV